jgi:biotin transport system substrate-specific component
MSMLNPGLEMQRSRPLLAPMESASPWIATIVTLALASGFIALTAQTYMELRIGPVPITGQTLSVLLVGATLGSRLGAAAVLLYLAEGIAGLPVFSGANAGWAYFAAAPTGDYLVGFVAGAFVTGWFCERGWGRHVLLTALAMVIGNVAIYVGGVVRLADFVGWDAVWAAGVQPFLAGDAAKVALASGLLPGAWKVRGWLFGENAPPRM